MHGPVSAGPGAGARRCRHLPVARPGPVGVGSAPAGIPTVRADAEAVLAHRPDLVLAAGRGGPGDGGGAGAARGGGWSVMTPPTDFGAIRTPRAGWVRCWAPRRGPTALLAEMEARLAGRAAAMAPRRAIALEPRGLTAGPGSLRDAVLRAAGLENAADGRAVSLEALARMPPTLLVVGAAAAHARRVASDVAGPSAAGAALRRRGAGGVHDVRRAMDGRCRLAVSQ